MSNIEARKSAALGSPVVPLRPVSPVNPATQAITALSQEQMQRLINQVSLMALVIVTMAGISFGGTYAAVTAFNAITHSEAR